MALINAVKDDKDFKKASLGERFNRLPPKQKLAVLNYIKGKDLKETPLDKAGEEFTSDGFFKEMYGKHREHKRPRPMPGMNKMALMSGLMQVIRQFIGDPEEDEREELNEEYAERVGGSQRVGGESSPFDRKFAKAFQSEGAKGIAKLHKNLMSNIEYQTFLDGV